MTVNQEFRQTVSEKGKVLEIFLINFFKLLEKK